MGAAAVVAVPAVAVVVAGGFAQVNWFVVQVQPVVIGAQVSAVIWRYGVLVRSHSPWKQEDEEEKGERDEDKLNQANGGQKSKEEHTKAK